MLNAGGITAGGASRMAVRRVVAAQAGLLCLLVLVLTACSGNYRAGVQEWAQPTRDLLAQRTDEAIEVQDEVMASIAKLSRSGSVASGDDLDHQQVTLNVYRYGQAIQAIRDVLERRGTGEIHPEDRQPLAGTPVAQLAGDLEEVHRMMRNYMAQQPPSRNDAADTVSMVQLQQAARRARADAHAIIDTLQ